MDSLFSLLEAKNSRETARISERIWDFSKNLGGKGKQTESLGSKHCRPGFTQEHPAQLGLPLSSRPGVARPRLRRPLRGLEDKGKPSRAGPSQETSTTSLRARFSVCLPLPPRFWRHSQTTHPTPRSAGLGTRSVFIVPQSRLQERRHPARLLCGTRSARSDANVRRGTALSTEIFVKLAR